MGASQPKQSSLNKVVKSALARGPTPEIHTKKEKQKTITPAAVGRAGGQERFSVSVVSGLDTPREGGVVKSGPETVDGKLEGLELLGRVKPTRAEQHERCAGP